MIHYGDITKISGYDVPIVDCVVGGSPCQDLSVAGKRAGLDGERSGLFMEQIRLIKEMRDRDVRSGRTGESIRPRFMVWENVPGAFSSNKGEDFKIVLEETAKVVDKDAVIPMPPKNKWSTSGCIVGDGWSIAWRVCDAQFWGVPQRRRRIALVADFGGGCAQEILFVRKGLRGDSSESRAEGQATSTDAQGCIGVHDREGKTYGFPLGFRPENVRCYEETATTLVVGTRAGFCNGVIVPDKPYTLKIRSGCEGGGKGALIQEDKSATLATFNDQVLFQPVVYSIENHPNDSRVLIDESGKVQTLTSRMGTSGGNVPMVMVEGVDCYNQTSTGGKTNCLRAKSADTDHIPCVVIDRAAYNQGENAKFNIGIDENGVAFTHTAKGPGAVGYVDEPKQQYVVRRLTPTECERLQGFPDGWTDIGDYIDSKGKKKKASDSARYKALGNSIALPSWKWIVKRISALYERDATLASLFDGIGGFPLLWEQINGKGSCIWGSEIEDFPIAVTEVRINNKEI